MPTDDKKDLQLPNTVPTNVIFWELGNCIATDKADFVELLQESGVSAGMNDLDDQLAEKFVVNVPNNRELLIGAAYLCAFNSSSISFSGEKVVSNDHVHNIGRSLWDYFDMSEHLEDQSNFNLKDVLGGAAKDIGGGAASGGLPGAIVGALKSGTDLAGKISDKKSRDKWGGLDFMQKQQAAKSQIIQSALAAKKAKQEAAAKKATEKAKTKRIIYITIGVLATAALVVSGVLIYKARK